MKTCNKIMGRSILTIAIQGALGVMFAVPVAAFADDDVSALTNPTNTVDAEVKSVSGSSAKFGEYNGLNKAGDYFIGNLNVRGGDAYGQGDGLTRWSLLVDDLGTTSDRLQATMSKQGEWNVGIGYDQLQHNITDSYSSPFLGNLGGNTFTLPSNFGVISTGSLHPLGTQQLSATQLADFQNHDVYSSRNNSSLTAGYNLNTHWNFQVDFNEDLQSGAKLTQAASNGASEGSSTGYWKTESPVTLMTPTNYRTETLNFAANWQQDASFMTVSYLMSYFRNADTQLSWDNSITSGTGTQSGYQVNMLSTMPDNDFYQVNVKGGTSLSPTMKLAGGFSYGTNTQNTPFLVDPYVLQPAFALPAGSLAGLVNTTNANVKLTDQYSKDLTLSAGLKFDRRDNETPSNVYHYYDLDGGLQVPPLSPTGTVQGPRVNINTPFSYQKEDLELAADLRIDSKHTVRFAYVHEDLARWCNNLAGAAESTAGAAPIGGYAASLAGANCEVVPSDREDTVSVNYRGKASPTVSYTAGYSFADRQSSYDHDAITSLNNQTPGNQVGLVNASDVMGFLASYEASRLESAIKGGVNWQANDALTFGVNAKYIQDSYPDSTLGVQNSTTSSINLDVTYNASENSVHSVYLSYQDRERSELDGQNGTTLTTNYYSPSMVAPTNIWQNSLSDQSLTLGYSMTQKGMMKGKLDVKGDVSLSIAQSQYDVALNPGYSSGSGATIVTPATCANANIMSCGALPVIYYNTLDLTLKAKYQIDNRSRLVLGYQYQQLLSSDYVLNTYQYGYTPTTAMPTNQQSPNYAVTVVTAAYVYNF